MGEHRFELHEVSGEVAISFGDKEVGRLMGARALVEFVPRQLPEVLYLPRRAVEQLVTLSASDRRTRCPIKGEASYYHAEFDGRRLENAIWAYENPIADAQALASLVALDATQWTVARV